MFQSKEGEIWGNIIGDVYQFIGHCLIPLHPWFILLQMHVIILAINFHNIYLVHTIIINIYFIHVMLKISKKSYY